ncbi:hypothetical protein D3C78_1095190 [compost metagenome]
MLGAAGAGQQADAGFRQGQLCLTLGDADVAGQRALQATTHGVAVDRGDAHAAKIAQRLEGFAEQARHAAGAGLVAVGEQLEVGAGAEELAALAGDHQGVDVIVAVEMLDQLVQADQRVAVPGVGGRVVDGDQRGMAVLFHGQLVGQIEGGRLVGFDGVAHDGPRLQAGGARRGRGFRPLGHPAGGYSVRLATARAELLLAVLIGGCPVPERECAGHRSHARL